MRCHYRDSNPLSSKTNQKRSCLVQLAQLHGVKDSRSSFLRCDTTLSGRWLLKLRKNRPPSFFRVEAEEDFSLEPQKDLP
jgi:hypothetical protein